LRQTRRRSSRSAGGNCLLKTQRDRHEEVEAAIRATHPYKVPEILAIPIDDGNPDYLAWIQECLRPEVRQPQKEKWEGGAEGTHNRSRMCNRASAYAGFTCRQHYGLAMCGRADRGIS